MIEGQREPTRRPDASGVTGSEAPGVFTCAGGPCGCELATQVVFAALLVERERIGKLSL